MANVYTIIPYSLEKNLGKAYNEQISKYDSDDWIILQDIDVPEWQTNQMITFEVTDLDAYWSRLDAKDLPRAFAGVKLRPPTDFPWGREMHIVDPGGVCWHVRQARA